MRKNKAIKERTIIWWESMTDIGMGGIFLMFAKDIDFHEFKTIDTLITQIIVWGSTLIAPLDENDYKFKAVKYLLMLAKDSGVVNKHRESLKYSTLGKKEFLALKMTLATKCITKEKYNLIGNIDKYNNELRPAAVAEMMD